MATYHWKSGTRSSATARKNKRTGTTTSKWTPSATYSPNQFSKTRKEVTAKIYSFRTINQQVTGNTKVTAFSPSGVNKWINFVNNGARVFKFTSNDFNRHFGKYFGANRNATNSPSTVLKKLQRQYGAGIKAVTMGKGNSWLVAATPNVSARPFNTFPWK